jgi:hypothetical protein
MSRRPRRIDDESPRYMERVGKPRIVDGPIQREGLLEAAEAQRLRQEAPAIVASAIARGWAKMPLAQPPTTE